MQGSEWVIAASSGQSILTSQPTHPIQSSQPIQATQSTQPSLTQIWSQPTQMWSKPTQVFSQPPHSTLPLKSSHLTQTKRLNHTGHASLIPENVNGIRSTLFNWQGNPCVMPHKLQVWIKLSVI